MTPGSAETLPTSATKNLDIYTNKEMKFGK